MAVVYYKQREIQQANETTGTDGIVVPQDEVPTDEVPTILATYEAAVASAAEGSDNT